MEGCRCEHLELPFGSAAVAILFHASILLMLLEGTETVIGTPLILDGFESEWRDHTGTTSGEISTKMATANKGHVHCLTSEPIGVEKLRVCAAYKKMSAQATSQQKRLRGLGMSAS